MIYRSKRKRKPERIWKHLPKPNARAQRIERPPQRDWLPASGYHRIFTPATRSR